MATAAAAAATAAVKSSPPPSPSASPSASSSPPPQPFSSSLSSVSSSRHHHQNHPPPHNHPPATTTTTAAATATATDTDTDTPNPSTLEPLLSHFLAAKRALAQTTSSVPRDSVDAANGNDDGNQDINNSTKYPLKLNPDASDAPVTRPTTTTTTPIIRANDLVTAARSAVEVAAILRARTGFLRRSVQGQVAVLKGVVEGLGRVGEGAEGDFQTVIRSLDAADARLKQTLSTLRNTTTYPALTPTEPSKPLYTFVDERSIDDVTAALRASIDAYRDAGDALLDSTVTFDEAVANLDAALDAATAPVPEAATRGPEDDALDTEIGADAAASSIPMFLKSLETHATEMAGLLQGLVRHYDLCVTALKHTEGGGQAAIQAAKAELDASGGDVDPQVAGLDQASRAHDGNDGDAQLPAPISEAERAEMMAVLDNDAAEVDDVVAEIKDRANDMELDFESLEANLEVLKREDDSLKDIAQILQKLGAHVPTYVKAGSDFLAVWQEEKTKIADKLAELEALRDFYEGFLTAYDGLLIEVGRRRNVQLRTEKIMHDALAKIQKLYQEDLNEREAFKTDQGEFLPSDIWPGLTRPPAHYEFHQTDQDTEVVPDIPSGVIDNAIKRINGKT